MYVLTPRKKKESNGSGAQNGRRWASARGARGKLKGQDLHGRSSPERAATTRKVPDLERGRWAIPGT